MAARELEDRVGELERKVDALLRDRALDANGSPWWRRIAGAFENDPEFEEAMQLAREYRQSQRLPAAGHTDR